MNIEYENADFLIINKPAGVPVYSTAKNAAEESVLKWFLEKYPAAKSIGDPQRPGIVHRLDKQTSGLLFLAKTTTGFEHLGKLFRSRDIRKEYLTLVYGEVSKHGIIDRPLAKIGHEGQSRVRVDESGKEAVTEYWPLQHFRQGVDSCSLLRVKLHTGRTHQIRVHLTSIGHPVMGDNLYGKPKSQKLSSILSRQFLHASKLEFKLMDGTWLEVESELPENLRNVLNELQQVST
ncbi:MAG: RNA pseudouridine synthase [Candidatus Doudnabacteria bacterium]|nr:RNA pseudouridine synthase [Candidatus Doudnabacteria bacterium]